MVTLKHGGSLGSREARGASRTRRRVCKDVFTDFETCVAAVREQSQPVNIPQLTKAPGPCRPASGDRAKFFVTHHAAEVAEEVVA